jgi:hypothetical protein
MLRFLLVPLVLISVFVYWASPGWDPNGVGLGWDPDGNGSSDSNDIGLGWDPNGTPASTASASDAGRVGTLMAKLS